VAKTSVKKPARKSTPKPGGKGAAKRAAGKVVGVALAMRKSTTKSAAKSATKSIAKSTTKSKTAKAEPRAEPRAETRAAGREPSRGSSRGDREAKAAAVLEGRAGAAGGSPAAQYANQNISPPAAVPTNGKPAKNQAGFKPHEIEHFRGLLLEKRRELVGDMGQMEREALQRGGGSNLSNLPIHMADMGTDNYEQEFTLGLMEKDRNLLREINSALARIQNGTYGICEGTGKPIGRPRLEAQPWARFSIEWATKLEKRMGR
jgi:DnaK suppressor protein